MSFVSRNHRQQTDHDDPSQQSLFDFPASTGNQDVDDRAVPQMVFEQWNKRFRFSVDVAASKANAKLPRFYTAKDNGLSKDWAGERVYCNPPYSNLRPWVSKAVSREAELAVLLLPANRTEQSFWQELIEEERRAGSISVEFLPGRMRFLKPGQHSSNPDTRPPFGLCLVIIGE